MTTHVNIEQQSDSDGIEVASTQSQAGEAPSAAHSQRQLKFCIGVDKTAGCMKWLTGNACVTCMILVLVVLLLSLQSMTFMPKA